MDDWRLKHGAFSWNELMTTDVEAARKFYTRLFGWESESFPMEGMTYEVLKVNGEAAGGIMRIPEEARGMPPMWTVYVTVHDCDATARKVQELGGKILRPPTDTSPRSGGSACSRTPRAECSAPCSTRRDRVATSNHGATEYTEGKVNSVLPGFSRNT